MSASQRNRAAFRAVDKGKAAHAAGEPRTANPYKPSTGKRVSSGSTEGGWSLSGFWSIGWDDAERANPQPKVTHAPPSEALPRSVGVPSPGGPGPAAV